MSLLLHASTKLHLPTALPSGAGSVIFHGPNGVGKRSCAMELGRVRNCSKEGAEDCLCHSCSEWRSGSFPDLILIAPEDKPSIGVEVIRGLTQRLSLAAYYDHGSRIIIIDAAETLTVPAQNALLKLIEEPPPRTNIILITTNLEGLLPTVTSRCRSIYFPPLSTEEVMQYLTNTEPLEALVANDLAELSGGAVGTALRLNRDNNLFDQYNAISSKVDRFLNGSLFVRLIVAKELSEQKDAISIVIETLYQQISAGSGPKQLISLDRLRKQLTANVAPRAAFERLALEIGA